MIADKDRFQKKQSLREMIEDIEIGMLTTITSEGLLRSRPMVTARVEESGDLWFFTLAGAPKVEEAQANPRVNVSYAAPEDHRYVSITGTATLVRDPRKIQEWWDEKLSSWFPQGPGQPNLALLKVTIEQAEYWDSGAGDMVQLASLVSGMGTGAASPTIEHEKIDVHGETQR